MSDPCEKAASILLKIRGKTTQILLYDFAQFTGQNEDAGLYRLKLNGRWHCPDGSGSWFSPVPGKVHHRLLDWVICGGETGPGARPMNPRWVEDLQDQCSAAEVPFFFKSFGEWAECDSRRYFPDPEEYTWRDAQGIPTTVYHVGKRRAGRLPDGRTWDEFPEVMI